MQKVIILQPNEMAVIFWPLEGTTWKTDLEWKSLDGLRSTSENHC